MKKLFGYGSLLDPRSAGRTLGRVVAADELVPVRLRGFRRTWGVVDRVFSEAVGREVVAAFLDIRQVPGESVNGALFALRAGDLERLGRRERSYRIVDVSREIEPRGAADGAETLLTFCGLEECRPDSVDGTGIVVMAEYVGIVRRACELLGDGFAEEFERTTEAIPYEILPGHYRFVEKR